MRRPFFRLGIAGLIFFAIVGIWWTKRDGREIPSMDDSRLADRVKLGATEIRMDGVTFAEWRDARPRKSGQDPTTVSWVDLQEWKLEWEQRHKPGAFAQALIALLDSGEDLQTNERFQVGPNGRLRTAPSTRIAALDWLGEADPEAAADYARTILEGSRDPAEWALALRNYGRMLEEPWEDAYYEAKVRALINNQSWATRPGEGFLEAFDAAVFVGSRAIATDLMILVADSRNPIVRQAAYRALDSLALKDPMLVAQVVNNRTASISERPAQRAALVARLDPRDPLHVSEVERYLLDVAVDDDEVRYFMDVFPNANGFASYYLLTEQSPSNLAEQAQVDRAARRLTERWQSDPEFARHSDSLARLDARLSLYVESAIRGGFLPAEAAKD